MTEKNQYQRVVRKHTIQINASTEKVFPLLCPVRESEWLPGFHSKTVYSDSGISELDAVFLTHEDTSNEAVWTIPVYEKDNFIELVYYQAKLKVVVIKLQLNKDNDTKTSLQVEYTYTALSEEGNKQVISITEESFKKQISIWEICFNYLFKTGTKISEELLLKHH